MSISSAVKDIFDASDESHFTKNQAYSEGQGRRLMKLRNASVFGAAFLDGFSMAGFFTPLRRPGAPTQVFADEPSEIDDLSVPVHSVVSNAEVEKARMTLVQAGFEVQLRRTGTTR